MVKRERHCHGHILASHTYASNLLAHVHNLFLLFERIQDVADCPIGNTSSNRGQLRPDLCNRLTALGLPEVPLLLQHQGPDSARSHLCKKRSIKVRAQTTHAANYRHARSGQKPASTHPRTTGEHARQATDIPLSTAQGL